MVFFRVAGMSVEVRHLPVKCYERLIYFPARSRTGVNMNTVYRSLACALISGILAALVVSLSGCLSGGPGVPSIPEMMQYQAVSKFPTFAETEAAWRPIPAEHGRVVVFVHGGIDVLGIRVGFEDGKNVFLLNKTFVFIDLPAGKHSMKLLGMILIGPEPVEFVVAPGDITYLRVAGRKNPLDAKEAQAFLPVVHHRYRLPLPFDQQDKSAEIVR